MKVAGMLIVLLSTTAIGYLKSVRLVHDVLFWDQFAHFIRYAENSFRYLSMTNREMICSYNRTQSAFEPIRLCGQYLQNGTDFPNAWKIAVNDCAARNTLPGGAADLLKSFGDGLGTTDLTGQLNHCALYRAFCDENRTTAITEKNKKARLYIMLGMLAGFGTDMLLL